MSFLHYDILVIYCFYYILGQCAFTPFAVILIAMQRISKQQFH